MKQGFISHVVRTFRLFPTQVSSQPLHIAAPVLADAQHSQGTPENDIKTDNVNIESDS
jgi:hypothetical protein